MSTDVCGEEIDLYPSMPGNLIEKCAREPHSKRAWHRNAENTFQWRQPKKKQ